jgi:hypothetical protein
MQSKSDKGYWRIMALAGAIGVGVFAGVYAFSHFDPNAFWNLLIDGRYQRGSFDFEPKTWLLTPLYALPVLIGLLVSGRLRLLGLIWLTVAITGAHWLAQTGAVSVIGWLKDIEDGHEKLITLIIGAVGGFVGAFLSFCALIPLHRRLRQKRQLISYGVFTLVLCLAATISFGFMTDLNDKPWVALTLYGPWQLLFTAAIAASFRAVTGADRVVSMENL